MAVADELKNIRGGGYLSKSDNGMDSGKENKTPRIIKLSDDEQKSFAQAKPGEDLECIVHGTLEEDGHFHVMSVSPPEGESYGEEASPDDIAQRMNLPPRM